MRIHLILIVLALLTSLWPTKAKPYAQRGLENPYAETPKCEPIKAEFCQGLPYNVTIFPNDRGHTTQEEAKNEVFQYNSLVRVKCSPSLQLFLCALYFPVCTAMKKPLPPCRSLCEQNRRDCEPLMRGFNFEWPESMSCDLFPEGPLCVSDNKTERKIDSQPSFVCPLHMRVPPSFEFSIRMSSQNIIPDCGIPCNNFLFSDPSSRRFSRLWIGLWSCLCAASTLFTVLTFLIDMPRFQYPERPIIFLSACYLMVALTYVAGFILNDQVVCSGPFNPNSDGASPSDRSGVPGLITQGTKFEGCIVLFMLLYFFSMASSIWWVVLTITWYLAAKCHWAHEAISRNAQYLHFAAWAIPAAKTIGILALGKVDGDPLSGVCFTGLTDPRILRGFLIAPLCVYLAIGTCFLFAGFISLFKIRTIIKTGGSRTDDLEKLIMRIGVFSLLYIVPAIVVIACYLRESRMAEKWMLNWYITEVCHKVDPIQLTNSICFKYFPRRTDHTHSAAFSRHGAGDIGSDVTGYEQLEKPEFELFMIKYLMTLIVGITSGIWIWSGKTLVSWQRFFSRLGRRRRGCCGGGGGEGAARDEVQLHDALNLSAAHRRGLVCGGDFPAGAPTAGLPLLHKPSGLPAPMQSISSPPQLYLTADPVLTGAAAVTGVSVWPSARGAPSGLTSPPSYTTVASRSIISKNYPTNVWSASTNVPNPAVATAASIGVTGSIPIGQTGSLDPESIGGNKTTALSGGIGLI